MPPGQSPTTSRNTEAQSQTPDDEPDEWEKRVSSTGCAAANLRMSECFYEKKDWRLCTSEVSPRQSSDAGLRADVVDRLMERNPQVNAFKECWKRNENDRKVETRDV